MISSLKSALRPALVLLAALSFLTGMAYPLATTLLGRALFPRQSSGSVIRRDGRVIGSALIAQPFHSPRYFWPRPSAADYNGAASSGSNLGPTNPELLKAMKQRAEALRAASPPSTQSTSAPIPPDLLTASGSGLDPHISPAAAFWQAPRVAQARRIPLERLESIIRERAEGRTFGILGEPRVNVLELNLALDALVPGS